MDRRIGSRSSVRRRGETSLTRSNASTATLSLSRGTPGAQHGRFAVRQAQDAAARGGQEGMSWPKT